MTDRASLTVALISEVFFERDAEVHLRALLGEAKRRGAELAVLPEIPLNPWAPATRETRDEDAEPIGGPRQRFLSGAAREVGIAVVGGAIVLDPATGQRSNESLVFDEAGRFVARYAKLHLPDEPGFFETSHYGPGTEPPRVVSAFGFPLGLQICSDTNRPEGTHLLAAQGALVVFVPRATELRTYERWKTVFRANALTSSCYVLSVNRPRPEQGVLLGGPSIAVAPDGEVLAESGSADGEILVARLERSRVETARCDYPGYLPVRSSLYAEGWSAIPPDRGYRKNPSGQPPATLPRRRG